MAADRFGDQPLEGWRTWYADGEGRLRSTTYKSDDPGTWALDERGRCVARCRRHDAPAATAETSTRAWHACGFHAWKDEARAWRQYRGRGLGLISGPSFTAFRARVVGKVLMWGRVIEHELGWRAQYAYPYELWCSDPGTVGRLRSRYMCDVWAATA